MQLKKELHNSSLNPAQTILGEWKYSSYCRVSIINTLRIATSMVKAFTLCLSVITSTQIISVECSLFKGLFDSAPLYSFPFKINSKSSFTLEASTCASLYTCTNESRSPFSQYGPVTFRSLKRGQGNRRRMEHCAGAGGWVRAERLKRKKKKEKGADAVSSFFILNNLFSFSSFPFLNS